MIATIKKDDRRIHYKIKRMKKLAGITMISLSGNVVNAQNGNAVYIEYNSEMFQIAAMIFVVGMCMWFFINVLRRIFEHRLKNKIVDKGISETMAQSILETKSGEDKNANIKWFAILAGIGLGLTGVNYTQPLGFHSLAIMAFSISLSFLGYYLFTRNSGK